MRDHQVVVVAGETGSGKTTQLPKIAVRAGPPHDRPHPAAPHRRAVGAPSASREECEVELGAEVGYAVRFDDQTERRHRDPPRHRRPAADRAAARPAPRRATTRSSSTRPTSGRCRSTSCWATSSSCCPAAPTSRSSSRRRRSTSSASPRCSPPQRPVPIIEVSGRTYPVEVRYRPLDRDGADDQLDGDRQRGPELPHDGDILVFLSGEREIRDAAEFLAGASTRAPRSCPLYGRLAAARPAEDLPAPARAAASCWPPTSPRRRSPCRASATSSTPASPASRASASGSRCSGCRSSRSRRPAPPSAPAAAVASPTASASGCTPRRTSTAGPSSPTPRSSAPTCASVLLQMASLDLGDIRTSRSSTRPTHRAVSDGLNLLYELGALDPPARRHRPADQDRPPHVDAPDRPASGPHAAGRRPARLPAPTCSSSSPAMSIQDPRERPLEHQQAADEKHRRFREPDSDFLSYLTLWTYIRELRDELSQLGVPPDVPRRVPALPAHPRVAGRALAAAPHRQGARSQARQGPRSRPRPRSTRPCCHGLLSHVGLRDADGREYLGARRPGS